VRGAPPPPLVGQPRGAASRIRGRAPRKRVAPRSRRARPAARRQQCSAAGAAKQGGRDRAAPRPSVTGRARPTTGGEGRLRLTRSPELAAGGARGALRNGWSGCQARLSVATREEPSSPRTPPPAPPPHPSLCHTLRHPPHTDRPRRLRFGGEIRAPEAPPRRGGGGAESSRERPPAAPSAAGCAVRRRSGPAVGRGGNVNERAAGGGLKGGTPLRRRRLRLSCGSRRLHRRAARNAKSLTKRVDGVGAAARRGSEATVGGDRRGVSFHWKAIDVGEQLCGGLDQVRRVDAGERRHDAAEQRLARSPRFFHGKLYTGAAITAPVRPPRRPATAEEEHAICLTAACNERNACDAPTAVGRPTHTRPTVAAPAGAPTPWAKRQRTAPLNRPPPPTAGGRRRHQRRAAPPTTPRRRQTAPPAPRRARRRAARRRRGGPWRRPRPPQTPR